MTHSSHPTRQRAFGPTGLARPAALLPLLCALGLALGCVGSGGGGRSVPSRSGAEDPFEQTRRQIEDAHALGLPAGNYRVDVERAWLGEQELWAIGAMFGYTDENIDVELGEPAVDPGFRVGVAKDGFRGELSAIYEQTRTADRSNTFLVTVPDSPASLFVGTRRFLVPVTVIVPPFGAYTGGLILPEGQDIGTSLEVVVSPAGEGLVRVSIIPSFSGLGDDRHAIRLTEMSTTVITPLGRPLVIGSHDRRVDDVATTLLSRRSLQGEEQGVIVLTVTAGG